MSAKSYFLVVVLLALVFSVSLGHYKQGKGHKQWCSEDIGGACTLHDECQDSDVIDARCRGQEVCCKIQDTCLNENDVCNSDLYGMCQIATNCQRDSFAEEPGVNCCDGLVCC